MVKNQFMTDRNVEFGGGCGGMRPLIFVLIQLYYVGVSVLRVR
jgi:hypothetical protein